MKEVASFTKYINQYFYLALYSRIESYHARKEQTEMKGMTIKAVHVEAGDEMPLRFEVIAVALFQELRTSYECWFQVMCEGDLEKQLSDFRVLSIQEYTGQSKILNPLSDALVPYIRKSQLDELARILIKRYYPSGLWENRVIDPIKLVKKQGLNCEFKKLSKDGSILGETVFVSSQVPIYDENSGKYFEEEIQGGTILIDPSHYLYRNVGSMNNTIIHECIHWMLHRKAFMLEQLFNSKALPLRNTLTLENQTSIDWMEWQAKALAPRIQMPVIHFQKKVAELRKVYRYLNSRQANLIDEMEYVIDGLENFYHVSRAAAKIRLLNIGIEEARGIYKYVEGKYAQSYVFKEGSLSPNQTFSIRLQDAIAQSQNNLELKAKLERGNYLFVDAHFCLNMPKYLTTNPFGKTELTRYARLHMEECCLIFDLVVRDQEKEAAYFDEVLYRDANSDIHFEAHFSNGEKVKEAILIRKRVIELQQLVLSLPGSFSGTVEGIIQWSELKIDKIAEKTLLTERTLYRMRTDEDYNCTLESILQLCIGLHLPPEISGLLISRSTKRLGNSELHFLYRFLLTCCYTFSIYECNDILVAQDFKRLGKEI